MKKEKELFSKSGFALEWWTIFFVNVFFNSVLRDKIFDFVQSKSQIKDPLSNKAQTDQKED